MQCLFGYHYNMRLSIVGLRFGVVCKTRINFLTFWELQEEKDTETPYVVAWVKKYKNVYNSHPPTPAPFWS